MTDTQIVNIQKADESAIDRYIDRRSDFGNPFRMEKDGGDYTREGCINAFRSWFHADDQADLRERAREELKGKTLGCWCAPEPCHGDVIVGFLEGMECHMCCRTHSQWDKDGQHAVDEKHHAGIVYRYECGNCGAITEMPKA